MQEDQLNFQSAYTDFSRMWDWPNVPTKEELDRALAISCDLDPGGEPWLPGDLEEAQAYVERIECQKFRDWAIAAFLEAHRRNPDRESLSLMVRFARRGNTRQTIGLGLLRAPPLEPAVPPTEPEIVIAFTRLPRDLRWMGLDPVLPHLDGLLAGVYESPDHGDPAFIVALPPAHAGDPPLDHPFPQEHEELRRLLVWHGATPFWLPAEYALWEERRDDGG